MRCPQPWREWVWLYQRVRDHLSYYFFFWFSGTFDYFLFSLSLSMPALALIGKACADFDDFFFYLCLEVLGLFLSYFLNFGFFWFGSWSFAFFQIIFSGWQKNFPPHLLFYFVFCLSSFLFLLHYMSNIPILALAIVYYCDIVSNLF